MEDRYKHDADGISSIVSSLKTLIDDYKDRVLELIKLVETINGSQSWVDKQVKTSFIQTCNSYIELYKKLIINMENYVNYLVRKSESASAIERAYSRG
jgi:hypothetical protein